MTEKIEFTGKPQNEGRLFVNGYEMMVVMRFRNWVPKWMQDLILHVFCTSRG